MIEAVTLDGPRLNSVSVKTTFEPIAKLVCDADFVMDRSACLPAAALDASAPMVSAKTAASSFQQVCIEVFTVPFD